MRTFHLALFRISARVLFLSITLFLGLVFWYFPKLMQLDQFRPQAITLLKNTFHCRVEIGNIRGELIPYPGLIITHLTLRDNRTPRVLVAVGAAHLFISPSALLRRQLQFSTLRFTRPRFIRYRVREPGGGISWIDLASLEAVSSTSSAPAVPQGQDAGQAVNQIEIRNGSAEIWDTTQSPVAKWTADHFNGSYDMQKKIGAMAGRALSLGPDCLIDLRFDLSSPYPLTARVDHVDLSVAGKMVHSNFPVLKGHTSFVVKVRFAPVSAVHVTVTNLLLDSLQGLWIRGSFSFENDAWRAHLITEGRLPMTLAAEGRVMKDGWAAQATVNRYDAQLVQRFYDQPWLNRLAGRGSVTCTAAQSGQTSWSWQAEGKNFALEGSEFQVPQLSAQGDASRVSVNVHGVSPEQGTADVAWVQPLVGDAAASLSVNVASVTVRQVLEVFSLQSTAAHDAGQWNPAGYESWSIDDGTLQASIDSDSFHVLSSQLEVAGMSMGLKGEFGLVQTPARAHIQGSLQDIPVASIVESFFQPPSPISGTGQLNFELSFPLSEEWLKQLSGPVDLQILDGIVRELKTFYRISSVLNLTNYFHLRLPQVTTQGIVFQSISGHLQFQNGILSTDDLFLRSPIMNLAAKGSVDLPGEQIHTTLRLEILHFIDDVLKVVPVTHWIFKKPNKFLFPLVVTVKGPWKNVEVR